MGLDAVEVTDDEQPPERRPPKGKAPVSARTSVARVIDDGLDADARANLEWMEHLQGADDVKLKIERKSPREWQGRHIGGHLESLDEKPDDIFQTLRSRYGGGKFQVQLHVRNRGGNWQFGKARTFEIAGDPILPASGEAPRAAEVDRGEPMADRAMGVLERAAERDRLAAEAARERADLMQAAGGRLDHGTLEAVVGPLREELASLRSENQRLSNKLLDAISRPPVDAFRDRILESAVESDSKRIRDMQERYEANMQRVRDDHATELRQIRTAHETQIANLTHAASEDAKRAEASHERALEDLRRTHHAAMTAINASHEREIRMMETTTKGIATATEIATAGSMRMLETQNKRLEVSNAALETELRELRGRKDKSALDTITEMVGLKDGFDKLSGAGEADEKSPWAQAAEIFAPVAMRVVDKLGGGEAEPDVEVEQPTRRRGARRAAPQPQAQQQAAAGAAGPVQYKLGDGARNPEDGMIWFYAGLGQKGEQRWEGPYTDQQAPARHKQIQEALAARRLTAQQQQRAAAPAQAPGDATAQGLADPAPGPAMPALRSVTGPPAPPAPPPGNPPTADQVETAVAFLEGAFGNKLAAEGVASTARTLMDPAMLAHIRHVGVDRFLQAVQKGRPTSRLLTQAGKTFVREVARHLGAQ